MDTLFHFGPGRPGKKLLKIGNNDVDMHLDVSRKVRAFTLETHITNGVE